MSPVQNTAVGWQVGCTRNKIEMNRSIRPQTQGISEGYATQMLLLALDYCRRLGLGRVMLSCNKDNTASRQTIVKCGGVLEREFQHTDGKTVQVY